MPSTTGSSTRHPRKRILGALALMGAGGCSQPQVTPDLNSAVPQERLMGLAEAAKKNDPSAAPEYVTMLESDDPAVRMFAIEALERLTGERFGYDFAAPEPERAESVQRWTQWLASQSGQKTSGQTTGL